jgi:hypothetical protein
MIVYAKTSKDWMFSPRDQERILELFKGHEVFGEKAEVQAADNIEELLDFLLSADAVFDRDKFLVGLQFRVPFTQKDTDVEVYKVLGKVARDFSHTEFIHADGRHWRWVFYGRGLVLKHPTWRNPRPNDHFL